MLASRKDRYSGMALTQADIKILHLVENTQRSLRDKQFYYKQLEKHSKFSDNSKTKQFIKNYIEGDKSKGIKLDQRIHGKRGFNQPEFA
jgi:hypothetical protein